MTDKKFSDIVWGNIYLKKPNFLCGINGLMPINKGDRLLVCPNESHLPSQIVEVQNFEDNCINDGEVFLHAVSFIGKIQE